MLFSFRIKYPALEVRGNLIGEAGMMHLLIQWLIYAAAILLTAYLLPGVKVSGFGTALLAALVLGLANAVLRPILVLLTLPLTIITLGLFILVINTLLILLTSSLVPGFVVQGFWWAFLFGIILSILGALLKGLAFG
jgi:putative membrane protein